MKEIIESIQKKLTGKPEDDTKFILEQLEQYRDNKEICDELYKILFTLLPKDVQNNFVANVNQKMFEERITEIQELVKDGQNERALKYLDRAIEKIEKVHEDEKNKYMTFHSPFEAYFYAIQRDKNDKKFITSAVVDFGTYYKFRGIVLNNLKRFEEAEAEFVESLEWNPMDYETIFEYARCLFNLKKYDEFYDLNLATLKTAYTNYAIACCYHNLGLYYTTKGTKNDDTTAFNLISLSIIFAETDYAYKDLNTLCEKYTWKKELANEKDINSTLRKTGIPGAPSEDLLQLLIAIARRFIGVQDQFALDVFRTIYALTHDDETLKYIKAGERAMTEKMMKKQ